jgi:hypothetical protein
MGRSSDCVVDVRVTQTDSLDLGKLPNSSLDLKSMENGRGGCRRSKIITISTLYNGGKLLQADSLHAVSRESREQMT